MPLFRWARLAAYTILASPRKHSVPVRRADKRELSCAEALHYLQGNGVAMRTITRILLSAVFVLLLSAGVNAEGMGMRDGQPVVAQPLESMSGVESLLEERQAVGESLCQLKIEQAFQRCATACGSRGIMHFDPGLCGVGSVCVCSPGGGSGPPSKIP